MSNRRVLVVGSYPPIPLPAAECTVDAVRRAWAEGDEVTVVSPRLSAAHLAVPVVGILAGRRLANLRHHTSATRVVVVMEPGFPVPVTAGRGLAARLVQWQTVRGMRQAFAGFEHVTLVVVGNLDVTARIQSRLFGAATQVIHHRAGPVAAGPVAAGPVTPLGPTETLPTERARQIAGLVARRVLGSRAGAVRARLSRAAQTARRAIAR